MKCYYITKGMVQRRRNKATADKGAVEMTYRGFDTQADAQTFARFLETNGFHVVGINQDKKLWKVHFEEKA